jgi:hypothetical protein
MINYVGFRAAVGRKAAWPVIGATGWSRSDRYEVAMAPC